MRENDQDECNIVDDPAWLPVTQSSSNVATEASNDAVTGGSHRAWLLIKLVAHTKMVSGARPRRANVISSRTVRLRASRPRRR